MRFSLPDGRTLHFAEYGAPAGTPVFYFHGWFGSHIEGEFLQHAAAGAGTRLIAVDRPGFGKSSFQPGRLLKSWPSDLVQLADHLNLSSFDVFGFSGGGPYALAAGFHLPKRVRSIALVSSVSPLKGLTLARELPRQVRLLFWLSLRSQPILRLLLKGKNKRGNPAFGSGSYRSRMPASDRDVLADPGIKSIITRNYEEAFCSGTKGPAWDLRILASEWGFDLKAIPLPIHLWHGESDRTVPIECGHCLSRELSTCRSVFLPNEGHLSLLSRHKKAILQALKVSPPGQEQRF